MSNLKEEEEEHRAKTITECFDNKKLMQKDVHFMSESMWKNEESKTEKIIIGKCQCKKKDECKDDSCLNRVCKIECENDCNCGEACENKIITKKQAKNVTVFDAKEKRLGLKPDEQSMLKEHCVAEYVGLAVSKDNLPVLLNENRNERMSHVMALDEKHA